MAIRIIVTTTIPCIQPAQVIDCLECGRVLRFECLFLVEFDTNKIGGQIRLEVGGSEVDGSKVGGSQVNDNEEGDSKINDINVH